MQIKINYESGLIIITPKIYLGLGEREGGGGEIQENQNPEFFCYRLMTGEAGGGGAIRGCRQRSLRVRKAGHAGDVFGQ